MEGFNVDGFVIHLPGCTQTMFKKSPAKPFASGIRKKVHLLQFAHASVSFLNRRNSSTADQTSRVLTNKVCATLPAIRKRHMKNFRIVKSESGLVGTELRHDLADYFSNCFIVFRLN